MTALRDIPRRLAALPFALRLFGALALALAAVGVAGYTVLADRLEDQEIAAMLATQEADAANFEERSAGSSRRATYREIGEILEAQASRPGTADAELIDPSGVVVAAGEEDEIGTRIADPHVQAVIDGGASYAGGEQDTTQDESGFEFITPVELDNGTHALEIDFTREGFAERLADIRETLIAVGLAALIAIALLFYLLGGRSLLRAHSAALQRATRDGLTDLPNQRAFQEDLEQAVAMAERYQDQLALGLLDLDHFKLINDRHGHPEGDAFLKRAAAVLREGRSGDRAYRIGGDEFAFLLPHTDEAGAETTVRRLSRRMSEAGIAVSIGVSNGRSGHPPDELRAEADAALYEAKRRGGGRAVHFSEIRERIAVTTTEKREAVARLIEEGHLRTVFQPIWDLGDQRLLGIEALTRPDADALAGPAEAFDIAEQIGRAHELDQRCVATALASVDTLPEGALLFLNLNPKTLELDSDGDDWFAAEVDASEFDRDRVVVEVTESLGARTEAVAATLRRLRGYGFKVALDDVGTGNAGLEMLRLIGPEFVKLDRTIVSAAALEPTARAVLLAMATFARQTGAFVIAEGIEDRETLEFLCGIEELDLRSGSIIQGGQGFGLGHPSPAVATEVPPVLPQVRGGDAKARPAGFEPATSRSGGERSIH